MESLQEKDSLKRLYKNYEHTSINENIKSETITINQAHFQGTVKLNACNAT